MKFITIEYDSDTKLQMICGAIVVCDEDGNNTNINCVNLDTKTLDSIEGIYIPKHGKAELIKKDSEVKQGLDYADQGAMMPAT